MNRILLAASVGILALSILGFLLIDINRTISKSIALLLIVQGIALLAINYSLYNRGR